MSDQSVLQFAEHMVSKSAFLRDHCKDTADYTDPNDPLGLGMLSYFGGEIVRQYDLVTPEDWNIIVGLMEEGMASEDEDVSIAIATGMIEAIVHFAEDIEGFWPEIEARLGPLSREYADAYRAWDRTAYQSS